MFYCETGIPWHITANILALAEGCLENSAPFWKCLFLGNPIFHRFTLTRKSLPTQIYDSDVLDYLATSALYGETVLNSAFTKSGKDMTKC